MGLTEVKFDDLPGARVLADGLAFPESPRFVDSEIYLSDMTAVRAVDLSGNARLVAELPTPLVLGIDVTDTGTVYAGAAFDRKIFRIVDGNPELHADLSTATDKPINEFVVLPSGAIIVGSMGFNPLIDGFDGAKPARMLVWSPDGTIQETGPAMYFANGIVPRHHRRTLWVMEAEVNPTVHRFGLAENGEILSDDPTVLPEPLRPDGMCLTSSDSLWYADMSRGGAVLIDAAGQGQVFLDVPEPHAPSCVAYHDGDREWLAICVTAAGPGVGDPNARTGRLIAAPLSEILAAADIEN